MNPTRRSCTPGMRHIDLVSADLPDATPVRIEDGGSGIVVIRNCDRVTARGQLSSRAVAAVGW